MPLIRWEDEIVRAVRGRHPLIYLQSPEEERVIEGLRALAPKCFAGGTLSTWSCISGLEPAEKEDTSDPVTALRHLIAHPRPGFCLMRDLSAFLEDPKVTRGLREAYFTLRRDYKSALVVLSPLASYQGSLAKQFYYVEPAPPPQEELSAKVAAVEKLYPPDRLPPELRPHALMALSGLTLDETEHVMHRVLGGGAPRESILQEIFSAKQTIARQAGFLEFVPSVLDTSAVGGLDNARRWVEERRGFFSHAAVAAGLPIPRGVLIMGISGCGKSLLAKSIAGLWQVPLFRLNMSLIFSGLYGTPEGAFHTALRTIEAVAPAVLWIDEMEASLSSPKEPGSPQAMTFSTFLTWLQEKPPLVFVAATANRIEMLPPEIIRKGRFDEVFFCDLPDDQDRADIIQITLQRNGVDPSTVDINRLIACTDTKNGAEIEQAIIAARIEAGQQGRLPSTQDIYNKAQYMVPLSQTMSEQIKAIRNWALKRATPASSRPYMGAAR